MFFLSLSNVFSFVNYIVNFGLVIRSGDFIVIIVYDVIVFIFGGSSIKVDINVRFSDRGSVIVRCFLFLVEVFFIRYWWFRCNR